MSPAYSPNPDDLFCWVGVIMYMPLNQSPTERELIRQSFDSYCQALQPLMNKYNAQIHWAKIELPPLSPTGDEQSPRLKELKELIGRKYPVEEFKAVRKALDPEAILSNQLIERLLD
jgi:L-galactono-1,4-lactone dehydrogenase